MYRFKKSEHGFITDCKTGETKNGKHKSYRSYMKWLYMISRCYNKYNKDYKTYGAKGIYISDEWHYYSNFKKWYDKNHIEGLVMDKDISNKGYYGSDSVIFITPKQNTIESTKRRDNSYLIGQKNPYAKCLLEYETTSTSRGHFKRACLSHGWNYCDFEEIFSEWYVSPNGKRISKYKYKLKEKI